MKYILPLSILGSFISCFYVFQVLETKLETFNYKIRSDINQAFYLHGIRVDKYRDMCKSDVNALQDLLEERIGNLERDINDFDFLKKRKLNEKTN